MRFLNNVILSIFCVMSASGMASTSGSYRYPADGVHGIAPDGKSIAFGYVSGKWSTTRIDFRELL